MYTNIFTYIIRTTYTTILDLANHLSKFVLKWSVNKIVNPVNMEKHRFKEWKTRLVFCFARKVTLQKTQCTFCCANKNLIKMSEKEVSMCTLSSKWKREFATYIIELPRNTRAIDFLHHVAFAFQIEEQKLANTTMSCVWAIFTYVFYNTLLNLDSFAIRIFGDFLFIQHM